MRPGVKLTDPRWSNSTWSHSGETDTWGRAPDLTVTTAMDPCSTGRDWVAGVSFVSRRAEEAGSSGP